MVEFMKFISLYVIAAVASMGSALAQVAPFSYAPKAEVEGHASPIRAVAFSLDGQVLLSGDEAGKVLVYLPNEKRTVWEIETRHGVVRDVAVAPGGKLYASVGDDGALRLWELATRKLRREVKVAEGQVNAVAFDLAGEQVLAAADDGLIRVYDVESGLEQARLKGHDEGVLSAVFVPAGGQILSASRDKTMRVWDLVTRQEARNLTERAAQYGKLLGLVLGPDGRVIATAINEITRAPGGIRARHAIQEKDFIQVRDGQSWSDLGKLEGHLNPIQRMAFSPDGRFLASAAEDRSVMVWDLDKKERVTVLDFPDKMRAVAFSPDGRWLAAGGDGQKLHLYAVKGVYSTPIKVVGTGRYNPAVVDLAPWTAAPVAVALVGLAGAGGVGPDAATVLGDTVRAALLKTGRVTLIDRANTNKILAEQRFQMSGAVSPESAVSLGRLLGAKALASGTVSKLGEVYTVSLTLTDVETGHVLGTAQEQARCGEEDLFLVASTAALKLAAGMK
jgi:WD40 repeat protein